MSRWPVRTVAERFWEKVDRRGPSDCWPWTGSRNEKGYGKFMRVAGQSPARANRLAWELTNGPIPPGLDILHSCDNPPCCNPAHLAPGTNLANREDSVAKGRPAHGSEHYFARLTADQVAAIRALATGIRGEQRRLARQFGTSQGYVSEILSVRKRARG